MDKAPVAFSWDIASWQDIAGILAVVVIVVVGIVVVVGILSKNGVQFGKFRAGVRRGSEVVDEECSMIREHTKLLTGLVENVAAIAQALKGILVMQEAQNEALDVVLGNLEGEKINGQVRRARDRLMKATGYQEAATEKKSAPEAD